MNKKKIKISLNIELESQLMPLTEEYMLDGLFKTRSGNNSLTVEERKLMEKLNVLIQRLHLPENTELLDRLLFYDAQTSYLLQAQDSRNPAWIPDGWGSRDRNTGFEVFQEIIEQLEGEDRAYFMDLIEKGELVDALEVTFACREVNENVSLHVEESV